MSDLKERLRKWSVFGYGHEASCDMKEAADRIAQLEAFVQFVAQTFDGFELGKSARAALGEDRT
jgi:hypothetical protein